MGYNTGIQWGFEWVYNIYYIHVLFLSIFNPLVPTSLGCRTKILQISVTPISWDITTIKGVYSMACDGFILDSCCDINKPWSRW